MALVKEQFFDTIHAQGEALTYGDVRIETAPAIFSGEEIDTTSRFTRNVSLKVPLVAAAMDTVSEAPMGIAMAKLGGIAVIHANMSVKEQKEQVRRVKLHLNGLVEHPITVNNNQTLEEVLNMCDQRGFDFRTFPVIDSENGVLRGLLTQNDIDFSTDSSTVVSKLMTPVQSIIKGSTGMGVTEAYKLMIASKKKTLPLLNPDGTVSGMYIWSDVKRVATGNPEDYNLDSKGRLIVAAAVPTDPDEALERAKAMNGYVDALVQDSADGDSKWSFETLKALKENTNIDVMAGNISTGTSARLLAQAGADGIKVGQGPGAICTTRQVTGNGTPQASAIHNSNRALRRFGGRRRLNLLRLAAIKERQKFDIPVCGDGGIEELGEISIGIASGADTIMMGSRYAGTDETPGEVIWVGGVPHKVYRGMGSAEALKDSAASRKRYGGSNSKGKPLPEGIKSYVPYKGSVADVVDQQVKALKKSMLYSGSKTIDDHKNKTRLIRNTQAGQVESAPHGVQVIPDN